MKVVRAVAIGALCCCGLMIGCKSSQANEPNNTRGQDGAARTGVQFNHDSAGAAGATPYMGGGTIVKDTSGTGGSGFPDAGTKHKKK